MFLKKGEASIVIRIWPCEYYSAQEEQQHQWVCEGQVAPAIEPHNSVSAWGCPELLRAIHESLHWGPRRSWAQQGWATGSRKYETLAPPQADGVWKGVFHPGKMASVGSMGEGISTGTLATVPSALSPKPRSPVYPHTTPVCSGLPSLCGSSQGEWLQMRFCVLAL